MKTRRPISSRLRRFLIVSVILHIIVGCATVIPYVVKRHIEEQRRLAEQLAREAARKKAEEETQAAAREMAKKKIEEVLKQDAYEFLIDSVDELEFEEIWEDLLAGLEFDIEGFLEQLEQAGYEIDPGQLEEMMSHLRSAELEQLLDQLDSITKQQIANWLLNTLQQSLPQFNARVEEVLASMADKTETQLESIFASEEKRREAAAERAITSLEKAEAQIATAEETNASLMAALDDARTEMEAAEPQVKKQGDDSDGPDDQQGPQSGPDGEGGGGPMKPGPSHGPDGPGGGPEAAGSAKKSAGGSASQEATLAAVRTKSLKSLMQLGGALQSSQHNLVLASRNADHTGEDDIGVGLRNSAKDVEDIAGSSVARTKELLTKQPKDIKPAAGFSAAPKALGYGDPQKLVEATHKQTEKTARDLKAVGQALSEHKQALRDIGKDFKAKADSAVADLYTDSNAAREEAEAFLEDTLKRTVAEDFRKRAEKIAGDVLKQRNMEADPGFIRALGQKTVEMLLGDDTKQMRENAFDNLLADTGEKYGMQPAQDRPNDATEAPDGEGDSGAPEGETPAGEPPSDGPEMPGGPAESGPDSPFDGPDGPGGEGPEAPGVPIAKGPSGEGPDGEGTAASAAESLDSGEGTQGSDDPGMPGVDPALMDKINKAMANMAKASVNQAVRQAKSFLKLPGPASFGQGPMGISLRVKQAMSEGTRPSAGGGSRVLIDLDNDLDMIGNMQRTGFNRMIMVNAQEVDYAKYRKNMESVIQGRELEESVLTAETLSEDASAAEGELNGMRHATIMITEETKEDDESEEEEEERDLSEPSFKAFAYGGAPMTFEEPVIDGDLSEWEELEDFALRARVKEAGGYSEKRFPKKWEPNRQLNVQWNLKGFYFAWRVVDDRDNIGAGKNNFWSNDGLELWFDFANKRSDKRTLETQQFWFWPVGSAHGPDVFGGEAKTLQGYNDASFTRNESGTGVRMATKRLSSPRGYAVELFLPAEVFTHVDLRPGRVIAFNYSINNGEECYLRWTANLGKRESLTPSLWGDLLLLGTDAEIAIVKPGTEDVLDVIVPGEPIAIQVKDRDMNTDRDTRDKIKVTLAAQNGDQLTGYLEETDTDTGTFEGSVDTELFLLQKEERFADSILQVAGGEKIEVRYFDEARRYGERNFQAKSTLSVGLPVLGLVSSK